MQRCIPIRTRAASRGAAKVVLSSLGITHATRRKNACSKYIRQSKGAFSARKIMH
jgi:hypothetical protein